MNKKIIIITSIIIPLIFVFVIFGRTEIKSDATGARLSINNKGKELPYLGYLFIGNHDIKIEKEGYLTIEETIKVKTGNNSFFYKLKTKNQAFIDKLPVSNEFFDIDYNKKDNFFFVINKSQDKDQTEKILREFFAQSGLDINNYSIVQDDVAGVGDKIGP